MAACVKCNGPIEKQSGKGRRPRYCSVECRRAGELEIKRVNRRLQTLEDQHSDLKSQPAPSLFGEIPRFCGCLNDAAHVEHLRTQIEAGEQRLRVLFDEEAR